MKKIVDQIKTLVMFFLSRRKKRKAVHLSKVYIHRMSYVELEYLAHKMHDMSTNSFPAEDLFCETMDNYNLALTAWINGNEDRASFMRLQIARERVIELIRMLADHNKIFQHRKQDEPLIFSQMKRRRTKLKKTGS